jgi:thiol-disulfide isomerase/thioredoxin
MSVIGGLIVLVVVLVAASAAGFGLRLRQGRFHEQKPKPAPSGRTDPADSPRSTAPDAVVTAAELGAPLGERATLVQFSTEFCTYCGPTRELLAEVARDRDGVAFVEIDAARRMDLTRRLRVMSTPTVLVLDSAGVIERRSSGQPRKPDLLAAVGSVLDRAGLDQAGLDQADLDRAGEG